MHAPLQLSRRMSIRALELSALPTCPLSAKNVPTYRALGRHTRAGPWVGRPHCTQQPRTHAPHAAPPLHACSSTALPVWPGPAAGAAPALAARAAARPSWRPTPMAQETGDCLGAGPAWQAWCCGPPRLRASHSRQGQRQRWQHWQRWRFCCWQRGRGAGWAAGDWMGCAGGPSMQGAAHLRPGRLLCPAQLLPPRWY